MANISGLLGTAGGFKGTGVSLPGDMGYVDAANEQQALKDTKDFIGQQQMFVSALRGQNGIQNQTDVFNQQQGLANQMQGVANGTGPSPAMARLNQATGNNVANQAALMAGQRGSSANPGLLARLAAQQGGNLQQQAVGQGATLQAQEQLTAMNALAQQQANMGNTANIQTGNLLNSANATRTAQQDLYNAQLNAGLGIQAGVNQTNAGLIGATAQQQASFGYAGASGIGAAFSGGGAGGKAAGTTGTSASGGYGSAGGGAAAGSSAGAGELLAAHGGAITGEKIAAAKEMVPGKAKVSGDSYKNDTVDAKLSPGEIVIPRSIAMHPDAPQLAMEFVKDTLEKQKMACGGMAKPAYADGGDVAPEVLSPEQQADKDKLDERIGQAKDFGQSFKNFLFGSPEERAALNPEMAKTTSIPATPVPGQMTQAPTTPPPTNISLGPTPDQTTAFQMPKDYNPTQGIDTQMTGIKQQANAESSLAQAQVPIYEDAQKHEAALAYQAQQNAFNYDTDMQTVIDQMKTDKVDPNRFINNMSGGQRIMSAIGLFLGGFGAAGSGTRNFAMDFLNQQIDNDIKSQEKNMGQKQNVLSAMNQQFQNKQDAVKMTRAFRLAEIEDQVKAEAAKVGTPIAQARSLQMIGPLQQERQQIQFQTGMRQAALQGMQSGQVPSAAAIPYLVQDKTKVPEAAKAYGAIEQLNTQENNLMKSFNDIRGKFMKGVFSPKDVASAKQAFTGNVQVALEHRYNGEAAAALANALFPGTLDAESTVNNKMQRLHDEFEGARKEHMATLSALTGGLMMGPSAPGKFTPRK